MYIGRSKLGSSCRDSAFADSVEPEIWLRDREVEVIRIGAIMRILWQVVGEISSGAHSHRPPAGVPVPTSQQSCVALVDDIGSTAFYPAQDLASAETYQNHNLHDIGLCDTNRCSYPLRWNLQRLQSTQTTVP